MRAYLHGVLRLLPLVVLLLLFPASAGAAVPPPSRPGPPLEVPRAALDASLACSGAIDDAPVTPVLLVPGTGEDPSFYDWTYQPALTDLGIPWCAVTQPAHATGDIQLAGQYVVHAIRAMHRRAGRRISIIGHSQGGMVPRWALRFWPDTRAMVDDLIGLAPSNHGTTAARAVCNPSCNAASQQQRDGSRFITALNAPAETWSGISYTVAYTTRDQVVTPNADDATGSSALRTGRGLISNTALQSICPADPAEHFAAGSYDAVAYALAADALAHPGPADAQRIDPGVCAQPSMPYANPLLGPARVSEVLANFAAAEAVPEEPPLACYADGTCPLVVAVRPARIVTGRRAVLTVRVRTRTGPGRRATPVRRARVRAAGARARTDRRGRAVLRVRPARTGRLTVRARARAYRPGAAVVRVRRP